MLESTKRSRIMHRKQFLLTKKKSNYSNLEQKSKIDDYYLYTGEDLEYEIVKKEKIELHLMGPIFDWQDNQLNNKQILKRISQETSFKDILTICNKYCGQFVIIVKFQDNLYLFHDATGQKEVYYDESFNCMGTQPKLLGLSVELEEHIDKDAIEYYQSEHFKKKCLFVGDTTHKKNIFHLLPNHLLELNKKKTSRFFPIQKVEEQPTEIIAKKCAEMLKGYISSISHRYNLKMAVTGGYDSRVLFLASLDVKCKYYVSKHSYMDDKHYDIVIPKNLTNIYDKDFTVEVDTEKSASETNNNYLNDIDFPRFLNKSRSKDNYTLINGSISEIARNYFGYHKNATAKDLCFLSGYSTSSFAIKQYSSWLKNKMCFNINGYNYLDMFYWEEKMGNWAAKSKTETYALGKDVIYPFNSRDLLCLLLSTNRKNRDSHFNRLYDLIISELSKNRKEIEEMPINPCRKQTIIRLMKYFKLYSLYRNLGIKTRKLKI